jgi:hypothetical protein
VLLAVKTRWMCGLLVLARSSRGPRRLSESASASASASRGLRVASGQRTRAKHGPTQPKGPTVIRRMPRGDGAPKSDEPEPSLLLGMAAGATPVPMAPVGASAELVPLRPGRRAAALHSDRIPGDFAGWAWRRGARARRWRAQDGGASRWQNFWPGAYSTWRLDRVGGSRGS